MAIPEGKSRLTITLPDDVLDLIDGECERVGCTRSDVVSNAVLEMFDMREMPSLTPQEMIRFLQGVVKQQAATAS